MIYREQVGRATADTAETSSSSELALNALFDAVFASARGQNRAVSLVNGCIAACSYARAGEPRAVAGLIETELSTGAPLRAILVSPRFWFKAYGEIPLTQQSGVAHAIRYPWVREVWLPSICQRDERGVLPDYSVFATTMGVASIGYAIDVRQEDAVAWTLLHTMATDPYVVFKNEDINTLDQACRWPEAMTATAPSREMVDPMGTKPHWPIIRSIAS